jgi:hypothetical protein
LNTACFVILPKTGGHGRWESRAVVVNLIANTTTKKGLKIEATLDENEYEIGRKVTDKQMIEFAIEVYGFYGEWNYKINANSN